MADNNHDGMKKCTKCSEWKPATAEFFNRDNTKAGGLRSRCKECQREHYQKNKDRVLERCREYRQKNKDKIKEYLDRTKEERKIKRAEYRRKNRCKIQEYDKKYIEENKEKIKERERAYRESPRGVIIKRLEYIRKKTGAKIYSEHLTEDFINMVFEAWEKNEIIHKAEQKIKILQEAAEKRAKRAAIEEIKKRRAIYCPELQMRFETATAAANILGIDQGCISKILRGDGVKTGYKKYPNGLSFEFIHPEPIYKKQTPEERRASSEAQRQYQKRYNEKKKHLTK